MLWDFIYKARFTPEKYAASRFFGYLSNKLSWVQTLAPDLKSEFTSLANALIKSNATRYCNPDTKYEYFQLFAEEPAAKPWSDSR